MKLFNSRKFLIFVIILNICLICFLFFYLFTHNNLFSENKEIIDEEQMQSITEKDDTLIEAWTDQLTGHYFVCEEGYSFEFGEDGAYQGFFDLSNTDITGNYAVVIYNNDMYLNLSSVNGDNVSYLLGIDDDYNFYIEFEDSIITLVEKQNESGET